MDSIQALKTKMTARKNLLVENIKTRNLKNILPDIEENTLYNIITQTRINPYAFLLSAIEEHEKIDHLYIATYRVSAKTANNFKQMLDDGLIKDFILVVNDNYETLMKHNSYILLDLDNNCDNFQLIQRNSHAKVTLIDANGEKIVISGSGNYSNNPKIEQYTIIKDNKLFEFHKEWMLYG